ncbi:MAG: PEP-CTERM sorting domain-containing protein [Verrucomicrobiota bacterium]
MKKTIITSLTAISCFTFVTAAHGVAVTDWVVTNGTATITNGSTSSPSFDAINLSVAANLAAPISLNDGEAISFTGSIGLNSGDFGDIQIRVGLFDGPATVSSGSGSGFQGYWASLPGSFSQRNRYQDGTATNPFSSFTGATDIGNAFGSLPASAAPSGIDLDYVFTLTRSGNLFDLFISYDNTANGGTFSETGSIVGLSNVDASSFTFNSAALLFGGTLTATQANINNADVAVVVPEPSTYALAFGGFVAVVALLRRRR